MTRLGKLVEKVPDVTCQDDDQSSWQGSRPEPAPMSDREFRLRVFGERYADATTKSFEILCPEQKAAVDAIVDYGKNIRQRLDEGRNLLLVGPVGTGKDHLMVCLGVAIRRAGLLFHHFVGAKWFDTCRERVLEGLAPYRVSYEKSDFLLMSDPQPAVGAQVSDAQGRWLYELVNARYVGMKPIIATINATDIQDAARRCGSATVDRLRDRAVVICTPWSTHRQASSVINGDT